MRRTIRQWLRAAFRRELLEREMVTEMRTHLDISTEKYVARGLPSLEARWAARREFGNVALLEEQSWDARGAAWVASLRSDLRHALRALRASPVFTTVAVLSLAIGIGANTAIFGLINAVMLKSLPVQRPTELALVELRDSTTLPGKGNAYLTNPMWEAIRDQTASFASYAVSGSTGFNLANGGETRTASGMWVNGDYFRTLGVTPVRGRMLTAADDQRGCAATAVVSYGFWQGELGGSDDVIGRTLTLNGVPFTVIAVAPPSFFGVDVGAKTQIYAPLCTEPLIRGPGSALDRRSTWWLRIIARPARGVTAAQLDARLAQASPGVLEATVPQRLDAKNRAGYLDQHFGAAPAPNGLSTVRTQYSKALYTLMAMVGIILLISCANVANLLLARGAARSREIAIRIAVGGSRGRLVRQFLTESLLLAAIGGAIGVGLAAWGSRLLVGIMGSAKGQQIDLDLSLDLRVLAFTALICLVTVMLFGLTPAWRATRVDPQAAMKTGGRGNIEGHSKFRIAKALVVVQCALALVLVVAAGLLVSTFQRLGAADPGFRTEGVMTVGMDMGKATIPRSQIGQVRERLLEQMRAIPGVKSAALAEITPVSGSSWNDFIVVDGFNSAAEDQHLSWFDEVSGDYFRTMGIRMVAGRDFGRGDVAGSTPVAVVNRAMVHRFFSDQSPIGKVYQIEENGKRSPPVTIVGVVENTKYRNLRETPDPIIYIAAAQDTAPGTFSRYVLEVSGSPTSITGAVKSIAASADPRIALTFVPLSTQLAQSMQRERVLAVLSGFFGTLALLLAMIGLYGVMAYTVARRRVEIGIRIALGAVQSRVVGLVLGDVARLIGIGVVLGAVVAFAGTRLLGTFLFGVEARDPLTMALAAGVLTGAALLAGAIPARRAASLQPVEALRED